jgi:hypothetical protein
MELVDFNSYPQNERMYGGTAGRKIGITINKKNYLLKFPGNLKEQNMKNIQLSYSNAPLCEYIGSHIYEIIGIPVHKTLLGIRNKKIVVACEDFRDDKEILNEFDKIKVTFEPTFKDSNGNETNGIGTDLKEILLTIDNHPLLKNIKGLKERFWDMFIVDALIGNADRNNSNWGILITSDGQKKIAPVYDNGNCLNDKWDDKKLLYVMQNPDLFTIESYKGRTCIYKIKDKSINPYHLIESTDFSDCNESVEKLTPVIEKSLPAIKEMITDIPSAAASEIQKQYFISIIENRYKEILLPALQKIKEIKNDNLNNVVQNPDRYSKHVHR